MDSSLFFATTSINKINLPDGEWKGTYFLNFVILNFNETDHYRFNVNNSSSASNFVPVTIVIKDGIATIRL